MSMEEWPDDHLDELFRKSAEEFEAQFSSDDWADMSRRLDENDRQLMFDRISRWGGISALVLLLLGGLGWIMYDKKPVAGHQQPVITLLTPARSLAGHPAESAQRRKPVSVPERQVTRTTQLNEVETQPTSEGSKREAVILKTRVNNPARQQTTDNTKNRETAVDNQKANPPIAELPANDVPQMTRRKPLATSAELVAARSAGKRSARQLAKKPSTPAINVAVSDPRPSVDNQLVKPSGQARRWRLVASPNPDSGMPDSGEQLTASQPDLVVEAATVAAPASGQPLPEGPWLPALTTATSQSSLVQQVRPAVEPALPAVPSVSRSVPRLSRLSVMLFASPDLSGVGLTNFDRPGTNAGLAIQYQLTDRLSVNTGAMYSTKRYQSYTENYVWPSYMNMDVWPEEISGVCKMFDIPLNIRYDWLLQRRGDGRAPARWFTSAGITSYFIQHEAYSYEYANPADPKIRSWGWDNQKAGRAGGSFGFSNLNVSIGYERPITNRLSWQIEPFMKVPLKQVGYFKVRLLSTGAFVGLRYRL